MTWTKAPDAEVYLGDGAFASFNGFEFVLRAPREHGDHWIALEPAVLREFLAFVDRVHREAVK